MTGSSQELYELFADLKKMFHQTGYILQQVQQSVIFHEIIISCANSQKRFCKFGHIFNMQLFAQNSIFWSLSCKIMFYKLVVMFTVGHSNNLSVCPGQQRGALQDGSRVGFLHGGGLALHRRRDRFLRQIYSSCLVKMFHTAN